MTAPFGLSLMRPFPDTTDDVPLPVIEIDATTQVGVWFDTDGRPLPPDAKHKRSETNKETSTNTSLDGKRDQGMDQSGDQD
jgi:putative ATP-grasp target RiPP